MEPQGGTENMKTNLETPEFSSVKLRLCSQVLLLPIMDFFPYRSTIICLSDKDFMCTMLRIKNIFVAVRFMQFRNTICVLIRF